MKNKIIVDHLFRHQYGKMVAILTRIFGLAHLETIQDAVQDTFIQAMVKWRIKTPENPEAWLTKAAKNRAIDLLRKLKVEDNKITHYEYETSADNIDDLFLEHEIEDSQLRMIFTACHPQLNAKDQIAFALKTIAGFSNKEIAVALLLKEETVKKRLSRARKTIKDKSISFTIPTIKDMDGRMDQVYEVLYLIFNEGFHSTNSTLLVRKELCGEAIRLCTLILKKEHLRTGECYALFAMFCYHSARLESKLLDNNVLLDLKNQDRNKWHFPLIALGNNSLKNAMTSQNLSTYHLEALIAAEHSNAKSFDNTNWKKILNYRKMLYQNHPTDYAAMNLVIVYLQLKQSKKALEILNTIAPNNLEKRAYLYFGLKAEYFIQIENKAAAIDNLLIAISKVSNVAERKYIERKIDVLQGK